jgi:hypothetical protein
LSLNQALTAIGNLIRKTKDLISNKKIFLQFHILHIRKSNLQVIIHKQRKFH